MHQYRILLVEDDPDDVFMIQKLLEENDVPFHATIVDKKKDYIKALQTNRFDIILCDHRLQQFNSMEALRFRNELHHGCPFILITGQVSEELAVGIIREGASDFILKDRLQRLPFAIHAAVEKARQQQKQIETEQSLKKSNERFEIAARASFDVIFDYDTQRHLLYCSESFTQIFGYESGEGLDPKVIISHIHPEDYQKIRDSFLEFIHTKETRWNRLFRMIRRDGSVATVNCSAILVYRNEVAERVIGVLHDYTAMARLQNKVLQQELEQQKMMAATAIQSQEKERKEIGKELHDNVSQLLATAKLLLETYKSTENVQNELVEKALDVIVNSIKETRNISHAMMQPSFDEKSFMEAIRDIAESINLSGGIQIETSLPEPGQLSRLNNSMKLAIYRIIQEQITNILRYAKATEGLIALQINGHFCRLVVADNGKGFDPEKKSKGIGFSNIANRTQLFNGKMEIKTAPGAGCRLEVLLPLVTA